ncbi:MAG: alpha-glucan family phosphorylase [Patescibacteria group bacterium]|nr:alpha-glucan family phosphorylase [Patescibacteria group bacterium]
MQEDRRQVAYFSMEVGVDSRIPTYSGGLGVLAGDFLKASADNSLPILGVTLLSRGGYFYQKVEGDRQVEAPVSWRLDDFLEPVDVKVQVKVAGRDVAVTAWKYLIEGVSGYRVPLFFLDTDLPENANEDRGLTNELYGGGDMYRMKQELILGVGGVRLLQELGYDSVEHYHLNEGHSSFLCLELQKQLGSREKVREFCKFTTHTPVPAGHDKFPLRDVKLVLSDSLFQAIPSGLKEKDRLNMTELALEMSGYINGVAKRHAQISRSMFPNFPVHSITNGVHAQTWTSEPFQELYDLELPDWRRDPSTLRSATRIEEEKIWKAHQKAKTKVIDYVNSQKNAGFDYDFLTLCWARRFTSYKRPLLFLEDKERLRDIANTQGQLQIIYAGKAHPRDKEGKELIREIIKLSRKLTGKLSLVYLENYNIDLAKDLVAGVDLWLNTPQPLREASGTSGMKCALNGVPQLSVLDGWWREGWVEGKTGWAFEGSEELYQKLEQDIVPTFYNKPAKWQNIMKQAIVLNASFFNASRMVQEYLHRAYR